MTGREIPEILENPRNVNIKKDKPYKKVVYRRIDRERREVLTVRVSPEGLMRYILKYVSGKVCV